MKHTALTHNTLSRFESFADLSRYTAEDLRWIEFLAYAANMGAESDEAAWKRFANFMLREFDLTVDEEIGFGFAQQEEEKEEHKPVRKISISHGNRKMGDIPSVSLPPVLTCAANCTCAKKCYAAKLCRIYKTVREAYARNLEILREDMDGYFAQVKAAAMCSRYFRFHVSGDIPDMKYLDRMVKLAEELPGTTFLAFTKQYGFVNDYLQHAAKPSNLQIIFSEWPGMELDNPHNLPVAHVIFEGEEPADEWKICGGNCSECACRGVGCWELKSGEHIAFYEH